MLPYPDVVLAAGPMSYDLTVWYDPKLRRHGSAMSRLERVKPAGPRELARLRALIDALVSGPLGAGGLSIEPVLDTERATVGLCLTGAALDDGLEPLFALLRARGMACWDPQEAVVHYADGGDSRAEQAPDGVHEGVDICLAELRQSPPLPVSVQREAIEALMQFALADSPDPVAAVQRALPVLLDLENGPEGVLRQQAAIAAEDLCAELRARGLAPDLLRS